MITVDNQCNLDSRLDLNFRSSTRRESGCTRKVQDHFFCPVMSVGLNQ